MDEEEVARLHKTTLSPFWLSWKTCRAQRDVIDSDVLLSLLIQDSLKGILYTYVVCWANKKAGYHLKIMIVGSIFATERFQD